MTRKWAAPLTMLALALTLAFAVGPTTLTVHSLKQNNYAVQPGDLVIPFTGCDNTNGNSFVASGQEVLLIQNTDGSAAHTFTVNSVPDTFGRTDSSLTGYSVPAGAEAAIQLRFLTGWQSAGKITLGCNDPHIQFSVLHIF